MEKKFVHTIKNNNYSCIAKEYSSQHGKGVDIYVSDDSGAELPLLLFRNIPDLADFEYYNSMDTEKLIDEIVSRIRSKEFDQNFGDLTENSTSFVIINDSQIKDAREGKDVDIHKWFKE